jgi:hypothetical protein
MPLFKEQMMVVIPPNHPLGTREAVRVKDLDGLTYARSIAANATTG